MLTSTYNVRKNWDPWFILLRCPRWNRSRYVPRSILNKFNGVVSTGFDFKPNLLRFISTTTAQLIRVFSWTIRRFVEHRQSFAQKVGVATEDNSISFEIDFNNNNKNVDLTVLSNSVAVGDLRNDGKQRQMSCHNSIVNNSKKSGRNQSQYRWLYLTIRKVSTNLQSSIRSRKQGRADGEYDY